MRAAVLGSPIAHSLSPALHRAAYAHLGLDWTYDAIECTEEDLPALLRGLGPEWAGLSLTMPLKAAVLPLLDAVDALAEAVGAVNTVVLRDGRRSGSNTDVPGLAAALAEAGVGPAALAGMPRVVVLGGGATARSAVAALLGAGAPEIVVVARRPEAFVPPALVMPSGIAGPVITVRPWTQAAELLGAPLVVSTVPRGAADGLAAEVPSSPGLLFDVLYDPWPTPLANGWVSAGGVVLGGLELLLHQAALQVQAMTGTTVAAGDLVAAMRPAGTAALAQR